MVADPPRRIDVGNPLSFPYRAALERAGLSRFDAAGDVVMAVARIRTINKSFIKVVDAILQHANKFHNRVFASVATLAETAGVAVSTVEVALKIMAELELLRLVSTMRELNEEDPCGVNDGPQRAEERGIKRRGHHPVNTYDISGFFYCAPHARRAHILRFAKKIDPTVNLLEYLSSVSRLFASKKPQSHSLFGRSATNPASSSGSDPMNIATGDTRGPASGNDSEKSRDATGPPGSLPRVSGVGLAAVEGNPEKHPGMMTTDPHSTPPERSSGGAVPTPIPRGIGMPKPSVSLHTGEKLSRQIELIAIRALQIIKLRPNRKHGNVPVEIVRTMGAKWALRLVEFWHWRNRQGSLLPAIDLGYLVNMWDKWRNDPNDHDWDEDFKKEMRQRDRAKCISIVKAMADYNFDLQKLAERKEDRMANRMAKTTAKQTTEGSKQLSMAPPPATPAPAAKVPLDIPADWLPGVPEEEAKDLCNRALRIVRVTDKNIPRLHVSVRNTARQLWERHHFPKVPRWSSLWTESDG